MGRVTLGEPATALLDASTKGPVELTQVQGRIDVATARDGRRLVLSARAAHLRVIRQRIATIRPTNFIAHSASLADR